MSGHGRPVRRRLTWLELALGAGIAAAALLGGVLVLSKPDRLDDGDLAIRDAQRIREAAALWREANPSGCPTLTQLKHEHQLSSDARTDDPWGGRYRVSCSSDGIVVVSPGRDQKPGTADDVRVPRG
ncbi:MAG: hypothetical protein IT377_16620 [Polyangiaceae bacterium]|nr:hypothetical protein [Polyangiaceae bacterium]